eukprot:329963-Chlamydomonas_euryale.AAC.4
MSKSTRDLCVKSDGWIDGWMRGRGPGGAIAAVCRMCAVAEWPTWVAFHVPRASAITTSTLLSAHPHLVADVHSVVNKEVGEPIGKTPGKQRRGGRVVVKHRWRLGVQRANTHTPNAKTLWVEQRLGGAAAQAKQESRPGACAHTKL